MLKTEETTIEFAVATEVKPKAYNFEASAKKIHALVQRADGYNEAALTASKNAHDKFVSAAYIVAEFRQAFIDEHGKERGWRKLAEELTGLKGSRISELYKLHTDPDSYERMKEAKAEAQRRFQERQRELREQAKASSDAPDNGRPADPRSPEVKELYKQCVEILKTIHDEDSMTQVLEFITEVHATQE